METVREIAFLCRPGRFADPTGFAFAVEAIRIQYERDFYPAWANYVPVKRPCTVVGYTDSTNLAPGSFAPIEIVASLEPQILGDHGGIEASDSAWGRSLPDSTVMSHEAMELAGDPFGDRWIRLPDGRIVALETADPVENDHYAITATIGGASREVWVSNFVYPAWFSEGLGQLDHMGLCTAPGDNRGYIVEQLADGSSVNVFASTAGPAYREHVNAKLARASRTFKRHNATHRAIIDAGSGPAGWGAV